jgi:hypothetical protein
MNARDRRTNGMFVDHEIHLSVGLRLARARLAKLAHGGWLLSASAAAFSDGAASLGRLTQPGSGRRFSRLIDVRIRDSLPLGGPAGLALRWEAVAPDGELFPALDADVTLTPAGDDGVVLALQGVYRPPPGTLISRPSEEILRKLGATTARIFTERVAEAITPARAESGSAQPETGEPAPARRSTATP